MVSKFLHRIIFRLFSTKPTCSIPLSTNQSSYRRQISVANLLQRYGFPPSQLNNLLSKNRHFLFDTDLNDIEKSMRILSSFKIPEKSLVSLILECPGVLEFDFSRKWEEGLRVFGVLGVSSSAICSVLEHSRRFGIDPDGVFECLRVLKGLGFSGSTLSRVLAGFPKVIMMKEDEIARKVEFLERIGIANDEMERLFYVFPEILGLGVENRLRPLLKEFRNMGFSMDDVRKEIVREPRVLGMELGELSRCLELLRSLKCREAIKERIFSEGAFRAGFEVKLRVDCLCKHGLNRREAFGSLWREPRAILYEIEDIENKIDFLVNVMGFDIGCLAEVPEYLGVNFKKQIVPRHNVIEYLRSKGGLGCEVGLKGLIKPSRNRFYNLYVKPYPECEKLFGKSVEDGGVKKRHPAGLWKLFKPPSYPQTKEDVKNMKSFVQSLV